MPIKMSIEKENRRNEIKIIIRRRYVFNAELISIDGREKNDRLRARIFAIF